MPIAAPLALAGATIGSSLIGAHAANKGMKAEVQSDREALALQGRMYDQQREDTEPWRRFGGMSLGDAYAMTQPGYDHTTSPGYEFRRSEGLRGIGSRLASMGLYNSGGAIKDAERYADGFAADDYDRQFNRFSTLAGFGSTANGQIGAAGQNYANQGAGILGNIGQARASGYAGQAGAYQQGLGSLASIFGQYGGVFGGGKKI